MHAPYACMHTHILIHALGTDCKLDCGRVVCVDRYAPAKDVGTTIGCNVNVFGDPAPGVAKV
jgi:hypothetical protein